MEPKTEVDPFQHHPGLRGRIKPFEDSMFRDNSLAKIRGMCEEHGLPTGWWRSDEAREAHRAEVLQGRMDSDLWVFAFGSLMWDPAMHFTEVRRARLEGYHRAFIVRDTLGGRGTEQHPGLLAALDTGGVCEGLVFRLPVVGLEQQTYNLWLREFVVAGYFAEFVQVDTDHGTVEALACVADHDADLIAPDISEDEQIELFATGGGFFGTSLEYLQGVVDKLRELGIEDAETEGLLAKVQAHRDTLS